MRIEFNETLARFSILLNDMRRDIDGLQDSLSDTEMDGVMYDKLDDLSLKLAEVRDMMDGMRGEYD